MQTYAQPDDEIKARAARTPLSAAALAFLDAPKKRMSALAQVCAVHILNGFTSTRELCAITGYGEKAIARAVAELHKEDRDNG